MKFITISRPQPTSFLDTKAQDLTVKQTLALTGIIFAGSLVLSVVPIVLMSWDDIKTSRALKWVKTSK